MDPRGLSIHDFTYELPEGRIAQQPLGQRDASKLLVLRDGVVQDRTFTDLPDVLPPDALLVLNDTRVVHARIGFKRATGAALECMVLNPEAGRPIEQALLDRNCSRWWCMMGNAKRWKGEELIVRKDIHALRAGRIEHRDGEHLIEFSWEGGGTFLEQLDRFGSVPLPPYMRRSAMAADDTRYNTVFGERDGSVAAPTASLHFSKELLERLSDNGVRSTTLTLHVGAGTFLPVKSTIMAEHAMHAEQVRITLEALLQLRRQLGTAPIVPVGTTALRTLESLYWHGVMLLQGRAGTEMVVGQWEPYVPEGSMLPTATEALRAVIAQVERNTDHVLTGTTRVLIAPGYTFRFADALVTNFHQPQSTLLLLVAAFVGPDWRTVYAHALANGYRFLSYGDGSLLFRS
ncbi:MAG: S-adenosylmethionine:tRNA ribosyltransferase-isomerase [Flavobacteriales bacterium]|nr:S-adenosylmethionine:tRNA ribosyltransferase-isomerase [Flavobacteriales bacterium]